MNHEIMSIIKKLTWVGVLSVLLLGNRTALADNGATTDWPCSFDCSAEEAIVFAMDAEDFTLNLLLKSEARSDRETALKETADFFNKVGVQLIKVRSAKLRNKTLKVTPKIVQEHKFEAAKEFAKVLTKVVGIKIDKAEQKGVIDGSEYSNLKEIQAVLKGEIEDIELEDNGGGEG